MVVALVMIWLVFCIWLACDWCFDGGDLVVVVLLLFSGIVLCCFGGFVVGSGLVVGGGLVPCF